MTVFAKRGFCLAAVVVFLLAAGVGAADVPYVISAGSDSGFFWVSLNGQYDRDAVNVSLDSALSVVRIRASGTPVGIHFDTTGGGVDVGIMGVRIARRPGDFPRWSDVTLSGAIRNSANSIEYAVSLSGEFDLREQYDSVMVGDSVELKPRLFNVRSSVTITNNGGMPGVFVGDRTKLTIDGGKHSAEKNVIHMWGENSETIIKGGEFTSKTGSAIRSYGYLEISGGTFAVTNGQTVWVSGGDVKISGGRFTAVAGEVMRTFGNVEITGGVFSAPDGGNTLNVRDGNVTVCDGAEFHAENSDSGATIVLSGGDLVLKGGVITNKQRENIDALVSVARAVSIASGKSSLTITGPTPPEIDGSIVFRAPGSIRMDVVDCLWKNSGTYLLEPLAGAQADGAVAVIGGGDYVDEFDCLSKYYEIDKVGRDIVVFLKPGVPSLRYDVTGDSVSGFTAVERNSGFSVGKNLAFQTLFGEIRNHADGRPCSLSIGSGNSYLEIGYGMVFSGKWENGWGRVSLIGRFICRRPSPGPPAPTFALRVTEGAAVINYADIINYGHTASVLVSSGSDYTHANGKLDSPIFNGFNYNKTWGGMTTMTGGMVPHINNFGEGAWVSVVGGTVGDTTRDDCAVMNDTLAVFNISGAAKIVSADTSVYGGTIINRGVLDIYGGRVSNVGKSVNGTSVAVNNNYDGKDTTIYPIVEISGTAEIFSKSSNGNSGVILNRKGEITISGGDVYNDADTVGSVIVNYGRLTISGDARVESESRYSDYTAKGTIYSASADTSGSASALNIVGGEVKAKDGYAVYSYGSGGVTVSGDAEITTSDPNGAIYIGANGYLKLLGGKVSSTYTLTEKDTVVKMVMAIDMSDGGRGDAPGRLEMGGSPIVHGIISIPGLNTYPITIMAGDESYPFDPDTQTYRIVGKVSDGHVVLKNGAGFRRSFVLDTAGNAGLNLAVNGNDVVATTGRIYKVDFSLNGAIDGDIPAAIPVIKDGTIGELAKPSTNNYVLQNNMYIIKSGGDWYKQNGDPFRFGVGNYGSEVNGDLTLFLSWTGDSLKVSVLEPTRDLPPVRAQESAAVAPVVSSSGSLTAGPSPVSSSFGAVSFFRSGAALKDGKLFIYDASGNMAATVSINDPSGSTGRRPIAKWNLQDAKGRKAAEGTYVARGVITTKAGKTERVSLLINVQK